MLRKMKGLLAAVDEIAYDNGCVHRHHTIRQCRQEAGAALVDVRWATREQLTALDQWLASLSEEDLQLVCSGEYSERQKLVESAPDPNVVEVLDELLEAMDP